MLLVVFGAGASYDSIEPLQGSRHDARPPLAKELFDDRPVFRQAADLYPEASDLFVALRTQGRIGNIEELLDRYQAEVEHKPARVRQLASLRFYIRHVIANVCAHWTSGRESQLNHCALLEQLDYCRIGDEPIVLVTFNYDTLIEQALGRRGRVISELDEYVADSDFPLFKLHGSVNWSREITITGVVSRADLDNGAFNERSLVKYAGQWQEQDEFFLGQTTFIKGHHFVPAIAVPVRAKAAYQCPNRHISTLEQHLRQVDRIITIGWRAQEEQFLGLLRNRITRPVQILACSGSVTDSRATIANLEGALNIRSHEAFEHGFSWLVGYDVVRTFLESTP